MISISPGDWNKYDWYSFLDQPPALIEALNDFGRSISHIFQYLSVDSNIYLLFNLRTNFLSIKEEREKGEMLIETSRFESVRLLNPDWNVLYFIVTIEFNDCVVLVKCISGVGCQSVMNVNSQDVKGRWCVMKRRGMETRRVVWISPPPSPPSPPPSPRVTDKTLPSPLPLF